MKAITKKQLERIIRTIKKEEIKISESRDKLRKIYEDLEDAVYDIDDGLLALDDDIENFSRQF